VTYAGYLCLAFSSLWLLGSRKETFFRLLRHPLWRKTGLVWLGICAFQLIAQARPVSVLARQDAEKLKMRQVIYHDRVAPFHTLARDFVIKLSGKPSYHGLTPEQVVASWLLYPEEWQHEPMFRVKSERLRQELGLKSEYAALVDLFDGKTYRLEGLLQRLQDEVRNTHEKGWLENRQAKKLEKEVLELDEKVGMVLMLQKGTFIRPLPEDGSVTPLSPLRIRAEIFYHAVPFTKILFMANLSLGLLALAEEAMKKEEKERKKRAKKGDTLKVEPKFFAMSVDAPSSLDLNRNIVLKFEEPVEHIDTAAIHMAVKVDSLWEDIPFILMADSVLPRQYQILADWQPGQEYQLKIDSLGIKGIYGLYTNKVENQLKVKTLEDYGTLYLNIVGAGPHAIVQLLNSSDGVVRQQPVTDKNTCDFYFLQPSTKYYIRLFNDDNNNGVWDTGNYAEKRQPEEVYYFPKVWEMKANFEFEETWDIHAVPLDKQKLDEIKKQKPDEAKKIKDRNKERARKLGRT
jgi:hypothetical protein